MFHPSNQTYRGGSYTDVNSLVTNSSLYNTVTTVNSSQYPLINSNLEEIKTVNQNYARTLSSLAVEISSAMIAYSTQYFSSINTQALYDAQLLQYNTAQSTLSTYAGGYNYSTLYYSSMIHNLSTTINTVNLNIAALEQKYLSVMSAMLASTITYKTAFSPGVGYIQVPYGFEDKSEYMNIFNSNGILSALMSIMILENKQHKSTYDGLSAISTAKAIINEMNMSTYKLYASTIIPSSFKIYSALSTAYVKVLNESNEEDKNISLITYTYHSTLSTLSSLEASKKMEVEYLQANFPTYDTALRTLAGDDATIRYISAAKLEGAAYALYNSTATLMQKIEAIYSLTLEGLPIPSELTVASGVQSGGAGWVPTGIVVPLVCNPLSTVCLANKTFLTKYIDAYNNLSIALPRYSATLASATAARVVAEQTKTTQVNALLQNLLRTYDSQLTAALQNITTYQGQIAVAQKELAVVQALYSSPTITISTTAFTPEQLAYLTTSIQSGGQILTQTNKLNAIITNHHDNVVTIPRQRFLPSQISSIYLSELSTYNKEYTDFPIKYNELYETLIEKTAALQLAINTSNQIETTNRNIQTKKATLITQITAQTEKVSSLRLQTLELRTAFNGFNSSIVNYTGQVAGLIAQRTIELQNFEAECAKYNTVFKSELSSEMDFYINTVATISTSILIDYSNKILNTLNAPIDKPYTISTSIISTMIQCSQECISYIKNLIAEKTYKKIYIDSKTEYDNESSRIISKGTRKYSDAEFEQLKNNYDIYISVVNNCVQYRINQNSVFVSSISTLLPVLDRVTYSYFTQTVQDMPDMAYTTNFVSTSIVPAATPIMNTINALVMTVDSTTGITYYFNQSNKSIYSMGVTTPVATFDDSFVATNISIKADNGYIYVLEPSRNNLYKIHNGIITNMIGPGIWLCNPKGISNVVKNILYVSCELPSVKPLLWLDASDSTNITGTTFLDKSGNGHNATLVGSVTSFEVNGLNALIMNGDSYIYGALPNISAPDVTIFVVANISVSESNRYARVVSFWDGNSDTDYDSSTVFGSLCYTAISDSGLGYPVITSSYTKGGPPGIRVPSTTSIYYSGFTQSVISIGVNGTTSSSAPLSGVTPLNLARYTIGAQYASRWGGFVNKINGIICEVLVYSQKLSNDDRKAVEGYLANKWDTTLPYSSSAGSIIAINTVNSAVQTCIGSVNNTALANPGAITQDSTGSYIYIADGNRIWKTVMSQPSTFVTSLFAGSQTNTAGYIDSFGINANFNTINDITVDSKNTVYALDSLNSVIRVVTSNGLVNTLSGIAPPHSYMTISSLVNVPIYTSTLVDPIIYSSTFTLETRYRNVLKPGGSVTYRFGAASVMPSTIYIRSNIDAPNSSAWFNNMVNIMYSNNRLYYCNWNSITVLPCFTINAYTLLTIPMSYNFIEPRKNLFSVSYIPDVSPIPTCPPRAIMDSTPVSQPIIVAPTTTAPSIVYGKLTRYIEIMKPNAITQIKQIKVIDRTGKNVAFGAKVKVVDTDINTDLNTIQNSSPLIWLNPSDSASVSATTITDKSGNGYNATLNSVENTSVNGLNALFINNSLTNTEFVIETTLTEYGVLTSDGIDTTTIPGTALYKGKFTNNHYVFMDITGKAVLGMWAPVTLNGWNNATTEYIWEPNPHILYTGNFTLRFLSDPGIGKIIEPGVPPMPITGIRGWERALNAATLYLCIDGPNYKMVASDSKNGYNFPNSDTTNYNNLPYNTNTFISVGSSYQIDFSRSYITSIIPTPVGTANLTVFIVCNLNNLSSGNNIKLLSFSNSSSVEIASIYQINNDLVASYEPLTTTPIRMPQNTLVLVTCIYTPTSINIGISGATLQTLQPFNDTAATFSPLDIGKYSIGTVNNTTASNAIFTGTICEVLVFTYALGNAERLTVEGYLATKWGLEARLPAANPYDAAVQYNMNNISNVTGILSFPLTTVQAPVKSNTIISQVQSGGQVTTSDFIVPPLYMIRIDLGNDYDVTAIEYIKTNTSYSSSGLQIKTYNSISTISSVQTIGIDLAKTVFDMRSNLLTPAQKLTAPITVLASRKGTCGILGRYVKISAAAGSSAYSFSQITVITTDGTNIALGKRIGTTLNTTNSNVPVTNLINGMYMSLPASQSFTIVSNRSDDYIIIDLGAEYDVAAVNIYYPKTG